MKLISTSYRRWIARIVHVLLLVIVTGIHSLFAQNKALRKGDQFYEDYAFSKAIKQYSTIIDPDIFTIRRLGHCYRFLGLTDQAEQFYAITATSEEPLPEDLYFYSAMLRSNGNYEKAEEWMDKYHEMESEDSRGIKYFKNHGLPQQLTKDKGQFSIQNLDVNSRHEDFGATYYKGNVVFASSREGVKPIMRRWNWNKLPFLDMYVATEDTSHQLTDVKPFDKSINKKFHEGPASFSQDGNQMAFTRNNYQGRSSDDIIKLQIFTREMVDGKWQEEQPFPYNSPEYSTGHPALTPDGNTMYFASDMPGGMGMVDLYISKRTDTGWSQPQNLGPKINTEGNEMFPFFHQDNLLIFASDGHVGIGGLDNFIIPVKSNGRFGKLINMGYPLNDAKDDFSVVLDSNMQFGFFSSNRPGGKGDDDIYSFELLKPFSFGKIIKGIAKDQDGNPLSTAVVTLWDAENNMVKSSITFSDGSYRFEVDENQEYRLNGSKRDYTYGTCSASTATEESEITCDVTLTHNGVSPIIAESIIPPSLLGEKKVLTLKGMENFGSGNDDDTPPPNPFGDPFGDDADDPFGDPFAEDDGDLIAPDDSSDLADNDDPFAEVEIEEVPIELYLEVRDHATHELLDSVIVEITDNLIRDTVGWVKTESGGFDILCPKEKHVGDTVSYTIHMEKQGYMSISVTYDHRLEHDGRYNLHEKLNMNLDKIEIGMDIAQIIDIDPIYFDLDKFNIREDAAHELDKIVAILNENPHMVIELKSHTDCRGSATYNMDLSDKRAKASAKYIHDRITGDPERIYGKGYGETQLVNDCNCEGDFVIPCTDEQHQANRRTEFTIIKME